MSEPLIINLFPAICLLLSVIFVTCLYRRTISRAASQYLAVQLWEHWAYARVRRDGDAADPIGEEYMELARSDSASISGTSNSDDNPSSEKETQPSTPLARYFDPHSSLLHEQVVEPASPPMRPWEWELQQRIDDGQGPGACIDRLVDSVAKRLQLTIANA